MKHLTLLCALAGGVLGTQFFPLTRDGELPKIQPYAPGQEVLIDCIQRNIETGEHVFDKNERIVYSAFPVCKETNKPLMLRYGVSEDVKCLITFDDELYHLFQLYVHEDAPFSCRIPASLEQHYVELGGAFVPFTFNVRGEVHKSHIDIDPQMNVVVTLPKAAAGARSVVSAVAWLSGTNATRLTIGETLTFTMAVRWLEMAPVAGLAYAATLPYADGFYRVPMNWMSISYMNFVFAMMAMALGLALIAGVAGYKMKRGRAYDPEHAFAKQD